MANLQFDPFASEFDSSTSIGAEHSDLCVCPECDERDMFEHVAGIIEDEIFDGSESSQITDDAIGAVCAMQSLDGIGAKSRKARRVARKAQARPSKPKVSVDDVTRKARKTTGKALSVVTKINRSPATAAALAATATIVPWGTAAAGVATAGLAITEGVLRVADAVAKAGDKLCPPFLCKKKRRRIKARRARRRARRRGGSIATRAATSQAVSQVKAVAQKATREVALNAEAKKLANVLTKAAQGDKKATQGIASLQLLANRDMLTAREFMRLRAQGMSENEAKKLAELSSAKVAREVGEVVKRAKKLAPGAKAKLSKKALAEIKASARAGAEKLIAVTNKAAKERGKVKGLVVARQPGKIVNRRSGTEKTTKGVAGYLISAKGRAIPGVWS